MLAGTIGTNKNIDIHNIQETDEDIIEFRSKRQQQILFGQTLGLPNLNGTLMNISNAEDDADCLKVLEDEFEYRPSESNILPLKNLEGDADSVECMQGVGLGGREFFEGYETPTSTRQKINSKGSDNN